MIRYLLILLTALPLLGQTFQGYTNVTDGLVGWWRFNEGTGTTANDSSGFGNHGTFTGSVAWTNGVTSFGIHLDGASYSTANSTLSLASGVCTLAWWSKIDSLDTSGFSLRLVSIADSTYNITVAQNTGSLSTQATKYQSTTGLNWIVLSAGRWTHIVVTVDANSNTTTVWTNAVQCSFAGASSILTSSGTGKVVCGAGINGSRPMVGSLDDVRVYNRALSSEEVKILYNRGFGQ